LIPGKVEPEGRALPQGAFQADPETDRDFEMDVFSHEEIRVFCKRTKQIEQLQRELRSQLEIRTGASVRAAAKRGEFVDYDEQYAAEKAKLGAELS
jgi:hypothetical protein